jgi:tetratricopeptide (TPR) repeat protein
VSQETLGRGSRELGVRYLVEGSVRKAADRVRIMTHLIDTVSGAHISADRFEGDVAELFDLQDQVTAGVIGAIAPKLEAAEIERSRRKPTASLDAYDHYLRGLSAVHAWRVDANREALRMFAKAVEIDRGFAAAYGFAARCYSQCKACGWPRDPERDAAEVRRLASLAVEFGHNDAVALSTAGIARYFVAGDTEDGAALIDRALELNPNLAMAWLFSGWVGVWDGDPERAIDHIGRAIRLSPADPQFAMMQGAMACAHFFAGRDAEAVAWAERALRLQPSYRIASCVLAASRAAAGQLELAQADVARLRRIDPDLRVSNLLDSFPICRKDDFARWAAGLRTAGLPE